MLYSLDRREFLSSTAGSVLGANDTIGVGFIGFGLIGKRHVLSFKSRKDVRLVALAEAHQGRLDEGAAYIGGACKKYSDFRQLLDDREVHVVVIATPDHWHALMTMMACAAGKDVYVEKPVTLFPREGRWMLDVARKHKRIVQVGTQQRSGPHYKKAREWIQAGELGKVMSVRMYSHRNIAPGFGRPADGDPPAGFDWEMFLGPAPLRRYNPNRGIYHFRWFWDTSGGQMTNLGHHCLDILDWSLGGQWPRSVTSVGGRFAVKDNGETPDTQDALFDYGDFTATWSHREASGGIASPWSIEFLGDKGALYLSRKDYLLVPDPRLPASAHVPRFTGAHPVGGPIAVETMGPARPRTALREDTTGDTSGQFVAHVADFLEAVRSRKQPVSDLESGHRVSTICHLANLSLRLGRMMRYDSTNDVIREDADATKWLERPYRAPWDRVRQRLLEGKR